MNFQNAAVIFEMAHDDQVVHVLDCEILPLVIRISTSRFFKQGVVCVVAELHEVAQAEIIRFIYNTITNINS